VRVSKYLVAAIAVALLMFAGHTSAGITTYTDRAAFDAALGNVTADINVHDEDFNSITVDTSFHSTGLNFNGFDAIGQGDLTSTGNIIDAPDPNQISTGKQSINGSSYLRGYHLDNSTTRHFRLTFDGPAIAWASDIDDIEQGSSDLQLSTGETIDLQTSSDFIGVIADTNTPFAWVQSIGGTSGAGDAVGYDNMTTALLIPEPASLMALVAATGILVTRRRRTDEPIAG